MPRSAEWFSILMVTIIGLLISLPFANDIARDEFSKTPHIIKWQVLDHHSEGSGTQSRTISINSINVFNVLQAFSMAESIENAVQSNGVKHLSLCILSKGERCGNLSANYRDGALKIEKPSDLNDLSESYGNQTLKSLMGDVISARNESDSWTVRYADNS